MAQKLTPATIEILWNRLISIVDAADASVSRTAFSSLVREAHDYGCALFDRNGREVCQGSMITPGQTGAMIFGVKKMCSMLPRESYQPGDVFIANDPWLLAGHLNDVCVLSPIFYKDKLVAFTSCVLHHTDIGGGLGYNNREVFEEGLFIPVVKLYNAGVANQAVLDMIQSNVRKPEDVIGDIRSQVAANYVCCQKIIEMMEEVGLDTIDDLADEIIQRTEKSMRDAIGVVPDGVYPMEVAIEQAGNREDIKIRLTVEVKGSDITVDFAGSDAQVDLPVNIVYNFAYAYTVFAIKSALNPDTPNNEGSTLPITVKAPEGSIVNCKFPAAVASRAIVAHIIPDMVYRALAPAIPKRTLAWSRSFGGSIWMHGKRYNGERFFSTMFLGGGIGASDAADGRSCTYFPGNAYSLPCEIAERDAPVMVAKKELICDSGGPGKMRGGLGQEVILKIPDGEYAPVPLVVQNTELFRLRHPPRGLFGGKEGSKAKFQINGIDREWSRLEFCSPGDTLRYCRPGGGGYGDPLERDPEMVRSDVFNEYVSLAKAKEDYGVIIDLETMEVNAEATQQLRASLKRAK